MYNNYCFMLMQYISFILTCALIYNFLLRIIYLATIEWCNSYLFAYSFDFYFIFIIFFYRYRRMRKATGLFLPEINKMRKYLWVI